jgi:hypothetical protein
MMALLGTISNPEVANQLQRLEKKLKQIAASSPPARPLPQPPKRRCGDISAAVTHVLDEAEAPMRIANIHAAVEARIGTVPRSTVKDCLAEHAKPGGRFVRIARGRYQTRP